MPGIYLPTFGLAEASPGLFYSLGGAKIYAFSLTVRGTVTQLGGFQSGYIVFPGTIAPNQRFYGMVYGGGGSLNNVFSVDLHANSLISYATQTIDGNLIQNLPDGTFLGAGGQISTGLAYLFRADMQGNVTSIYQFPSGEILPLNAIYGADGNYYGAAWQRYDGGSTNTAGYVYQITPSGSLTKLYNLPPGTFASITDFVPFLQGTDGNFYGATTEGGA